MRPIQVLNFKFASTNHLVRQIEIMSSNHHLFHRRLIPKICSSFILQTNELQLTYRAWIVDSVELVQINIACHE